MDHDLQETLQAAMSRQSSGRSIIANIHERECLWLLFFTGVHKSPHRTPKNSELANIAVVVVVVFIGVWGRASGASADAPGVGLELVSVLKYPSENKE